MKKESICFYDIGPRYSGKVEGTFPKIERNLLEAAQSYLRGGSFAVPQGSLSRKDRLLAEVGALELWFESGNYFLKPNFINGLSAVSSGAEHEVFFDPSLQLAIKLTRPGAFGHSVVGPSLTALPSECFSRWMDAQPHNVLKDDAGNLVPIDVVIGQPSTWTRDWLGISQNPAR